MQDIKLAVADLSHKDEHGVLERIARIDAKSRKQIGVDTDEIIEIAGKKRTVALVRGSLKGDKGKSIIRVDGYIRKSAGLTLGEQALVRRASVQEAKRIVIAPIDMRLNVDEDFINFVKNRGLIHRPFCESNRLCVLMLGHTIPFNVVRTNPRKLPVLITKDTAVSIMNEPFRRSESMAQAPVGIKHLLRWEWLNNLARRISADKVVFSILDYDIRDENEQKVIDAARKIADQEFSNVRIALTFELNGRTIGTLPWAEVDIYGGTSSIYPDIELPPPPPGVTDQATAERAVPPMKRCFKVGTRHCPKKVDFSPRTVVVAMPIEDEFEDVYRYAIRPALEEVGFKPWKADEQISNIDIMCKICHAIQQSGYLLANITTWNANVVFELGLAYGLARSVILIKHKRAKVPVDLKGLEYIEYGSIDELKRNLLLFLKGASATNP